MLSHAHPLVSTIVAGLVLAFIFGALANRLRLPPLIGYLLAGVIVGPFTPGFVADVSMANELAEIGVILLMFGVGLHFSLKDLLSVQALAVPGALLRIAAGSLMGLVLGLALGWSIGAGLLFGLALSVASTVVLLKSLQDRHLIDSEKGRIAVGWVIVEDIAMVLALVLIPAIASLLGASTVELNDPFVNFVERLLNSDIGIAGIFAVTLIKLAAFVGFMLVVGRRIIPYILHFTAHTGSRELFRLAVLAIALGVAAGAAYLFGVSLALGAFFAGMILSESELSHRAAEETLPLRDAFAVLFFVSVGMLFDPSILISSPVPVLATLFIILVGKSAVGVLIVLAFRRSLSTALVIAAGLAQVGEFSFILATLGLNLGILPQDGQDLIVAGAILSILLNPLLFYLIERLRPRLEEFDAPLAGAPTAYPGQRREPELVATMPHPSAPGGATQAAATHPTGQRGHAILIGYGRVGSVVGEGLRAVGKPFVVVEDSEDRIALARGAGIEVIAGNAASGKVLGLANVAGADAVLIAIPNAFEAGQVTEQCRRLNPEIVILARAHSDEEEAHLMHLGANRVIMGEREIGLGMVDLITRETRSTMATGAGGAAEAMPGFPSPATAGAVEQAAAGSGAMAAAAVTQATPSVDPPQPSRSPFQPAGEQGLGGTSLSRAFAATDMDWPAHQIEVAPTRVPAVLGPLQPATSEAGASTSGEPDAPLPETRILEPTEPRSNEERPQDLPGEASRTPPSAGELEPFDPDLPPEPEKA